MANVDRRICYKQDHANKYHSMDSVAIADTSHKHRDIEIASIPYEGGPFVFEATHGG